MDRVAEPELMTDPAQVDAYALADFSEPHDQFVALCRERLGEFFGRVIDLGCGAADITIRFARGNPGCRLVGIDGSKAMLDRARTLLVGSGLESRIELVFGRLPGSHLGGPYDGIVSNSLLHHLSDPLVLWQSVPAIASPGAAVFVMDLRRPDNAERVAELVGIYAGDEPPILRRDFERSLFAAYRPEEVRAQLDTSGLDSFACEPVGDRHLIVYGRARSGTDV